jgi:RHS repeat-associated protein
VYEPNHTTVITDDPAAVDEYHHEQGLVTTHVNALGHARHWHYNQHLELEAEQDALGQTTAYAYDGRGNCTAVTYPDGATVQTQYNAFDQPVQVTDAAGHTWQWQYDARGELTERTDPTRRHDPLRLRRAGPARGNARRAGPPHPPALRPAAQPDPRCLTRRWHPLRAYDALGRLVEVTDALGQQESRRYDRQGQLVAVRGADGRETRLAYDGEGNVVRAHDGRQEVTFAYTAVNRLAVRRQAGQEVRFAYDREGRLVALTNERGETYAFALDAAGRVVEEAGFDGLLRRYARDAAGRVVTVHRPAGRTTAYAYDPAGRVAAVTHNDETPTTYAYDAAGALREARTATTSVRFERDALGRVVQEYQGAHQVDYAYDARGQRTGLQSSLGATFAWQHDPMGHLRSVQAGDTWQAHLLHDARGLELQRQCSGGLLLAWQHDAAGRPTSQRVAVGHQPQRQRRYQWQGADQLAAIEDSLTGTTHYRYDALGALTGARYADGRQDVRLADAVGNLFRSPTLDDRQYAPGGQLRQAGGTRYRYDAEGNLTSKTTPAGQAWHYAWDGAGQLSSVTLPSGYAVTFAYDALGRRTSKRYRGRVTQWVWDGDGPLHEWTELEVGPGAGSIEDLATWLFEANSFAPTAKLTAQGAYSVVCDHLGTPLELYDQRGTKTWQAQLDSYGAVREGKGRPQDCPFRYQGQYEDTETGLYYNRFRYYDPEAGRYISQDPVGLRGGLALYSFVLNPNVYIDPLGLTGDEGIHRVGGNAIENLRLKPAEAALSPPGISVLKGGSPQDAARQMREAFPKATKLHEASKTVGTSTAEQIRQAGFDVISDPTKNFPNHHRVTHPDGVEGFSDKNLEKLSEAFKNNNCP